MYTEAASSPHSSAHVSPLVLLRVPGLLKDTPGLLKVRPLEEGVAVFVLSKISHALVHQLKVMKSKCGQSVILMLLRQLRPSLH